MCHLSIRAEDVLLLIEAAPCDAANAIAPILSSLHGPRCTFESAISVSAEILYRLWTSVYTDETRLAITSSLLGALRVGRDPILVVVALRSRLRNLFSPLVSCQLERLDSVSTQLLSQA
jgi:hypothetical protein